MDKSVASIHCNTEKKDNSIFREEWLNVLLEQHTHKQSLQETRKP